MTDIIPTIPVTIVSAKTEPVTVQVDKPQADNTMEPVTVGYKVKDSGDTIVECDSFTDTALSVGYDGIRVYKTTPIDAVASEALEAVKACQPRVKVAIGAIMTGVADKARQTLKPGGDRKQRAELKAAMKAALRAHRIVGFKP